MKQIDISKLMRALLLMSLMVASIPTLAAFAGPEIIDGITYVYDTDTGEAEVTNGKSCVGEVIIPETITVGEDAYTVTTIGKRSFFDCTTLTSVTIPNSVKIIGDKAFRQCSGLTSVTIGNSVSSIGIEAFGMCAALKEVHISDIAAWCNIDFSDSYANPVRLANLYLGDELVTDLQIPEGVSLIKLFAFEQVQGIISVKLPSTITHIDADAFYECTDIKDVHIPDLSVCLI